MALTYTPTPKLGGACPEFSLSSVDGGRYSLSDFKAAPAMVIMFICNHCPYVQAVEQRLLVLAREYIARKVAFVGICSNDASEYPEDSPEALLKRWQSQKYPFPYLVDTAQTVAKAFGAVCTPDLYVFDSERRLAYRGRLDDSWRDPARVGKQELRLALEAVLNGRPPLSPQNPAMGCSIKWK